MNNEHFIYFSEESLNVHVVKMSDPRTGFVWNLFIFNAEYLYEKNEDNF